MSGPSDVPVAATVTITLRDMVHVLSCEPGETIVQAAYRSGVHPPISCLSGNCGTCLAKVTQGTVVMLANDVLTPSEIAQGYVLTCQAVPTSPVLTAIYED